jgi:hypothetical protein
VFSCRVKVGVVIGLFAVTLAACSSNQSSPQVASAGGGGATSTTSAAPQDPTHVWAQWAACMRQHGVPMSDPVLNAQNQPQIDTSHSTGVPESVKHTANQTCASIVANVQGNTGGVGSSTKSLAFARCMRSHGLPNFPDPDPVTGRIMLGGQNVSSPQFQQAQATCSRGGGNG